MLKPSAATIPGRGAAPDRRLDLGLVGAAIGLLYPAFLAGIAFFDNGDLDPQWATRVIFVALVCLPAVIALVARKTRPGLFVLAGVLGLPLSLISLAGATLPLLIPSVLYLLAAGRVAGATRVHPAWTALFVAIMLGASIGSLTVHQDPVCWTRATHLDGTVDYRQFVPDGPVTGQERSGRGFAGSNMDVLERSRGCNSDRVMPWEIGLGVLFLVTASGGAFWMSKPVEP